MRVSHRLLSLVAGLGPALAVFAPVSAPARPWLVVGLGVGLGLVLYLLRRGRFGLALLGVVLATSAGLLAMEGHRRAAVRAQLDGAPTVDLREGAFPRPRPAVASVTGYFRDGWQLDEYAVAEGDRPDQSTEAAAVLVPFVGSTDDVVALDGPVVIARVEPARAKLTGVQTITGPTREAPLEILQVLVSVAGIDDAAQVEGVVVDTLQRPSSQSPWIQLVLATLAAIAAVVVYSVATHRPS